MYYPEWDHSHLVRDQYEQTIQFGPDNIIINGNHQSTDIYTAMHVDIAVAIGIIQSKTDGKPGPSTLVAFRDRNIKKPSTWTKFLTLPGSSTRERFVALQLVINWEIRGLNGGWLEKEFGNPICTLRVYSNANASSIVGNQVSDVLREVNFDSKQEEQQYFEPRHCQYLQVRQQEYEVMEVALDDLSGSPIQLGLGVTSVVLHFRHREVL